MTTAMPQGTVREVLDALTRGRAFVPLPELARFLNVHPDTLRARIATGNVDVATFKPIKAKTSSVLCLAADVYRLFDEEPPSPHPWTEEVALNVS